jgi:protein-ribulosamine 3-kinase
MLYSAIKNAIRIRPFSTMSSQIDSAVAAVLNIDPSNAVLAGSAGSGDSSATASKIKATMPDGFEKQFFIKIGPNDAMFAGEHASLRALHNAVPTICPQSYGHSQLSDAPGKSFLVTDFLEITSGRRGKAAGDSLAKKLATLHNTPAPVPSGHDKPMFGFPVPTCCGDTQQPNDFNSSWADFYAENRLRFIEKQSRKSNGKDQELTTLVERLCDEVVPRLIGDDHLNGGKGVKPVVVHGDLWSGNTSVGKLPGMDAAEDVTYDSSACYAHSEYELGDMKM